MLNFFRLFRMVYAMMALRKRRVRKGRKTITAFVSHREYT